MGAFAICAALLAAVAISGCGTTGSSTAETTSTASVTSPTAGASMAGAVVDIQVTPQAIASKPKPWVLTTPESAVRSYLDWTSYAYRIARSQVANDTMSGNEQVRVDSYIQLNIQKSQLIDQTLMGVTFERPSIKGPKATMKVKESWTYRYVSIKTPGETLSGPFSATYDSTYHLVKTVKGDWVVDSVDAKALDTVK